MTKFYLIRHGVKEAVMGDPPLSQLGVKQAEFTAKFLKEFNIISIYSSPLLRTHETAQIVGKELGLDISTDERLIERMNWGSNPDESFEEFLKEWEKASIDRNYQPRHGDSAFNTGERLKDFLLQVDSVNSLQVRQENKDKEVLVVTHGGTIGDFLMNNFTNLNLVSSLSGAPYVELLECSITTIGLEENKFTLKEVGSITHLPEPLI